MSIVVEELDLSVFPFMAWNMYIKRNPSPDEIQQLIANSSEKAARWLCDEDTGDIWYWASDVAFHRDVANVLRIDKYTKGLAIL